MANLKIKVEVRHEYNSKTVDVEVNLTEEENDVLIGLIRKDRSTLDIEKLQLAEENPFLYEKIDGICKKVAYETEGHVILEEGFEKDYFDYDVNLILFCRDNCGYKKSSNGNTILASDVENFNPWFRNYIGKLEFDEAIEFLKVHTEFAINLDDTIDEIGRRYNCELSKTILKLNDYQQNIETK